MAFKDERLLDKVAYGFTAGPAFTVTRVRLMSGWQRRNAETSIPLHRFVAPYNNIDLDDHQIIIDTFIACLGSVHSFRFKNYSDYQLNNVVIGTATGAANQTLQIIKPYAFADLINQRKITKPVDSVVYPSAVPLSVTANGTPIAFTCDYLTGIITFTATAGHTIRVTGEYDVPVFFDEDRMEFDYNNWEVQSGEVVLEEDLSA